MAIGLDEQPIPPNGLAHPIPPEEPRWIGPVGDLPQPAASEVGDAPVGNVLDAPST